MPKADEVVKELRKDAGGDFIGGRGSEQHDPPRLPSGIVAFDIASGGGWPMGRMSMVYSKESHCKTTMMLATIANFQRLHPDQTAVFIDAEGKLSTDWAQKIGVDVERLVPLWPDYAEQSVDWVEKFLLSEDVGLVVYDSIPALQRLAEVEKTAEEDTYGGMGLVMKKMIQKSNLAMRLARREGRMPTLLFVNQPRSKIGSRYPQTTLPGGRMMMHQMLLIVSLYGKKDISQGAEGDRPTMKLVKGTFTKYQLPVVSINLEFVMALEASGGLRAGQCEDWKFVAGYMADFGLLGKLDKGKGWRIMDQTLRTKRECRDWYEANKDACVEAVVEHLKADPEMA
jgi:RecA/RadA recombinase